MYIVAVYWGKELLGCGVIEPKPDTLTHFSSVFFQLDIFVSKLEGAVGVSEQTDDIPAV